MSNTVEISVVVPVYGCNSCLPSLCKRIESTLSGVVDSYEVILVDDASPDNSWQTIQKLADRDPFIIKGIRLSRNFGQHYAITAGLSYTKGNWVVVMDCDLQDQPEMISLFYKTAKNGYDVVVGIRKNRNDPLFKKMMSRFFYKIYGHLTGTHIKNDIGNFGIYSKKVIENVSRFKEQNRSFGLFVLWLGFSRTEIEIVHSKRSSGKSTYTLNKMLQLAFDSIIAHSNKPLKYTVQLGFLLSFFSILYAVWLLVRNLLWKTPIAGWASTMVSMYFLSGLIIGSIGMLGLYIGKIFDETKRRPLFIIDKTTFGE